MKSDKMITMIKKMNQLRRRNFLALNDKTAN